MRKVADGHGTEDPRLVEVASIFESLVDDLLEHQDREERDVFPAVVDAGAGPIPTS